MAYELVFTEQYNRRAVRFFAAPLDTTQSIP